MWPTQKRHSPRLRGVFDNLVLRTRAMFSERSELVDYCLTKVTGTEITALPPSGASNCAA